MDLRAANDIDVYDEEILAEQVRQLYALAPFGLAATVVNSSVIFLVLKEVMPYGLLALWLLAMLGTSAARMMLILRYSAVKGVGTASARTWANRFIAGLAASGVLWGSIAILPFSGLSIAHEVFIAFALGGMAAGAAATLAPLKISYPIYSIPALLPLTTRFFLGGDSLHYAMGVMMTLYGLILWRLSRHNYRINRTSLLLRFENRGMIERLKRANEDVQGLNQKLVAEIEARFKAEAELRAHKEQLERIVEERTSDLIRTNERLRAEIEERKQTEKALRESEERFALAQRAGRIGVFDWDLLNDTVICSDQLEKLFGAPPGSLCGSYDSWAKHLHPDDLPRLEAQFQRWIREHRKQVEYEYRFIRTDGQTRIMRGDAEFSYLSDGTPARMIGTAMDITDQKKLEEEIMHLAHHDTLTGLPNRLLFANIVEVELLQARRNHQKAALLFLDLDRFKEVNDTFGHEAGDDLLREVSKRLKATIGESDTAARIGGDEFNIVLADIERTDDVARTARRIIDALRKPFYIAGHEVHCTTSIGISVYPDDSEERENLYRYADIAMYHAKMLGRNMFQFYNPAINIRSIETIRLESMLRQSIDRGELVVHYQPQMKIYERRMVCAEALVRWNHPERGILEPKHFVPAAEDIGFITAIDEYVFRTACAQIRSWLDAGLPPVCISVNLSARAFENPDLVRNLQQIMTETGAPPQFLDIEITETLAMRNIDHTVGRLKELAQMGVHTSIDDFGTGYSSLNYLKRLPIERLKIDQSFIKDIATDADDRAIIRAVTAMAHQLRMNVLAEGVETEEQLGFLREIHCDEAQGYLFSRPVPAEQLKGLMVTP